MLSRFNARIHFSYKKFNCSAPEFRLQRIQINPVRRPSDPGYRQPLFFQKPQEMIVARLLHQYVRPAIGERHERQNGERVPDARGQRDALRPGEHLAVGQMGDERPPEAVRDRRIPVSEQLPVVDLERLVQAVLEVPVREQAGIRRLLLTGSCAAFAGYSVLARSLLKSFRPMELTWWTLGFGCVIFFAASGIQHAASGTWHELLAPLGNIRFIASVFYLGILSSLVTAFTANYALSRLEATKAVVFSNLSTVVSIAAGALVLGEPVEIYHLAGSLLIIAGVWGTNRPGTVRER